MIACEYYRSINTNIKNRIFKARFLSELMKRTKIYIYLQILIYKKTYTI